MYLESLLGAGLLTIMVGQSKVDSLGQNRVGANMLTIFLDLIAAPSYGRDLGNQVHHLQIFLFY